MKLLEVRLIRYRQFIDAVLRISPHVTVIVGKNDLGKTSLLDHFFDQCVYEGTFGGGDRPFLPHLPQNMQAPLEWIFLWDILPEDYDIFPLPQELGPRGRHSLKIAFRESNGTAKYLIYHLDGTEVDAYQGVTPEGWPMRKEAFELRHLLPTPYYLDLRGLMHTQFHMQPYELPVGTTEILSRHRRFAEQTLLRVAGIRAKTRLAQGHNLSDPWESPHFPIGQITIGEIEERFQAVSQRVTDLLRRWWHDPPDLVFRIRLLGTCPRQSTHQRRDAYYVLLEIVDTDGHPYSGTGLLWFVAFLIELLFIEDSKSPLLLLFDEPATPLHPSAQRAVAKLLSALSDRHQVLYSTHSPFMIDWNFPQRVRLFQRDPRTKQTHINNKPYGPLQSFQRVWDPLRSAIGVTLGDLSVVADVNLLVEGVSDQILLANASAVLQHRGQPHLDPTHTSINPYSDAPALEHLLAIIRAQSGCAVVLLDSDAQGQAVEKHCSRLGVPFLYVGDFSPRSSTDCSIEDVLGVDFYLECVNEFYGVFSWFSPLDCAEVLREIRGTSLGGYLKSLFDQRFASSLDKPAVAIHIAEKLTDAPQTVLASFRTLIEACLQKCRP